MAKLVYFMPVSKSYYKKSYYGLFYDVPLLHMEYLKCNPQINAHTLYKSPPRFVRFFVALQAN